VSSERKTIQTTTMRAVADEMADVKMRADELESHTAVMESLTAGIASLRDLPLRDVEPGVIFEPVERGRRTAK